MSWWCTRRAAGETDLTELARDIGRAIIHTHTHKPATNTHTHMSRGMSMLAVLAQRQQKQDNMVASGRGAMSRAKSVKSVSISEVPASVAL